MDAQREPARGSSPRLPLIDGLRGVAIAGVVFHHSFFGHFLYGRGEARPGALTDLLSSGWLGVNLFFFLSGLVLYLPYAQGRRRIGGAADARGFYRRRARRLLPLYFFMALLGLVFMTDFQLNEARFYRALLLYLTVLFPFFRDSFMPPGNSLMWSIGVELWLSALLPLGVVAIARFGWRACFAVVLPLAAVTRLLGHLFTPPEPGLVLNFVSDSVAGRLDDFVWGMAMAALIARGALARFDWRALLAGLALVLLSVRLWGAWYRGELPVWAPAGFALPLDAGMFLVVGHLARSRGLLVRALCCWPLQMLGLMCYSLYLWHGPVLMQYLESAREGSVLNWFAYLATSLALSAFTYRYIEFGHVRDARALLPARGA